MSLMLKRIVAIALCGVLGATARDGFAQASGKDRASAKALHGKGKFLLGKKKYTDAMAKLKEAIALDPSAQYRLDLARALDGAELDVEAARELDKLLVDVAGEPGQKGLQQAANNLRKKLGKSIATLEVRAKGPAPEAVRVTVDGQAEEPFVPIPVEPGRHAIEASAEGYETVAGGVVNVQPKGKEVFEVTLARASRTAASDAATDEALVEDDAGPEGSIIPALIGFGVGAVGIGVGSAFGIMAFGKTSDVEETCVDGQCPASQQDNLSTAKTFGDISTIGFVVGGVGVAAGVALLIWRPGGGDGVDASIDQAWVMPVVGPGTIGAVGAF